MNKQVYRTQSVKIGALGNGWYATDLFTNAHLVTDHSSNPDLFIENIVFIDPDHTSEKHVARVIVTMFGGNLTFNGSIFMTQDMQDISFSAQQIKYKDENNEDKYADIVRPSTAVMAQILRRAKKLLYVKEVVVADVVNTGGLAGNTQFGAQQPAMQQQTFAGAGQVAIEQQPAIAQQGTGNLPF